MFIGDCRPVICGFAFMLTEKMEDFIQLFTFLRKVVKFPSTIITDHQGSIIAALNNIKDKRNGHNFPPFCHLFDQFHILQSLNRNIRSLSSQEQRDLISIVKRLLY